MMTRFRLVTALIFLFAWSAPAGDRAAPGLSDAMEGLSASMMVNGGGWKTYESYLHPSFTRWNRSGEIVGRAELVDSLREWWETGARVADGSSRVIHLAVDGDLAVVRIERTERFIDGEGTETGSFRGYLTQIWRLVDHEGWKLFSVDVSRAPDDQ